MNYRDWLQQVIYKIINPVVHGMIRIGITPNFITTTGLVLKISWRLPCLCMPGCTRVVNWPRRLGRRYCALCRVV